jgi:hypothetical protein
MERLPADDLIWVYSDDLGNPMDTGALVILDGHTHESTSEADAATPHWRCRSRTVLDVGDSARDCESALSSLEMHTVG